MNDAMGERNESSQRINPATSSDAQDAQDYRELIDLFLSEMHGLISRLATYVKTLAQLSPLSASPTAPTAPSASIGQPNDEIARSHALREARRLANALTDLAATFHVDDCARLADALASAADHALTLPAEASSAGDSFTFAPDAALASLAYMQQRVDAMRATGSVVLAQPEEQARAAELVRLLGIATPADAAASQTHEGSDAPKMAQKPTPLPTKAWHGSADANSTNDTDTVAVVGATMESPKDEADEADETDESPTSEPMTEEDWAIVNAFQASAGLRRPGEEPLAPPLDAPHEQTSAAGVDLSQAQPLIAIPAPPEAADSEVAPAFDATLVFTPENFTRPLPAVPQAQGAQTSARPTLTPLSQQPPAADANATADDLEATRPRRAVRLPARRMPTAAELDEIPPEMKRLFVVESAEDLNQLAHSLIELEQRPDDRSLPLSMSRIAHKMKGSASTLGFGVYTEISILLEDVLKAVQRRQIACGPETLSVLSRLLELLQRARDTAASTGQDADPALANEARTLAGPLYAENAGTEQQPTDQNAGAPQTVQTPQAPLGGAGESLARTLKSGETEALLRVDIQRLDDLMSRLSGLAINRATLSQARDEITHVQNEMDETLQRLATMSAQITDLYPLADLSDLTETIGALDRRVIQRTDEAQRQSIYVGQPGARRDGAFGGAGGSGVFRPSGWLAAPQPHDAWDELEHERYGEFDHALRALSEVVSDVSALNMTLRTLLVRMAQISETQEDLMSQMQRDAMQMRLAPLAELVPRLQLAARVLAADLGKSVNFTVRGETTEIDRNISEALTESLLQLVRNAIVHGIESPDERLERGKPETGSVWLHAYYVGNEVTIEIGDDGRGLNPHRLIASAIALGYTAREEAHNFTLDEAYALMFRPGVSTMGEPHLAGGSGIGMDEVDVAIRAIRGTIQVQSEPGRGTVFRIRAPISLSIVRALHIVVGDQGFAAPFSSVLRTATIRTNDLLPPTHAGQASAPGLGAVHEVQRIRLPRGQGALALHNQPGRESITTFGVSGANAEPPSEEQSASLAPIPTRDYDEIPVFSLAELLGMAHQPRESELALIVEVGPQRVALLIDDAREDLEVVVRALPRHLRRRAIRGAAVLPDGQTLLLLDLPDLLAQRLAGVYTPPRPRPTPTPPRPATPRALIVDDSVTIRRTLQLTMERAGFEAQVARDGLEALDMALADPPQVMILDVEMPRLDGFELLSILRASPQLSGVRVMMLTSRAAHKHRDYALSLGADAYLVKPCPQEVLIMTARQLIMEPPEPIDD